MSSPALGGTADLPGLGTKDETQKILQTILRKLMDSRNYAWSQVHRLRACYPVDSIFFLTLLLKYHKYSEKVICSKLQSLMNISPESFDFMCHDTE